MSQSTSRKRRSQVSSKQASSEAGGYSMSASQLDELWHYEFELAHQWLDLPLRSCSAMPSADFGEKMNENDFKRLKWLIRTMWSRAGEIFSVTHDEKGYGLKVNESLPELALTGGTSHAFGWLVICPSVSACPTAHRYLRSPIGEDLYLGGPLSLCNWARTAEVTITAKKSLSTLAGFKFMYFINTVHPLKSGTEILWNYGIKREKEFPFEPDVVSSWVKDCCSDKQVLVAKGSAMMTPLAPRKRARYVESHRFCLMCGINVDENIKAHMARKHACEIANDICGDKNGAKNGTAFLTRLHVVAKVQESLKNYGYHLVPACHFLKTRNIAPLSSEASFEDKDNQFKQFLKESDEAFLHYKVIFLRGISLPVCYEDLLPLEETTYREVIWEADSKPAHGLFSINNKLTKEEMIQTEIIIKSTLKQILDR